MSDFFDTPTTRNRYHFECWDVLSSEGYGWEFTPGEGEPPERLMVPPPTALSEADKEMR